jgi:soluble P-type ATPase
MIDIAIPGRPALRLSTALVDFNGTLARDGRLIDGVAERLRALSASIDVRVVTGDTTGTAREALAGLPVGIDIMPRDDQEHAKRAVIEQLDPGATVAIGNGRNDRALAQRAALSIAVIGPEGCALDVLLHADVACGSIVDALDLLLAPRRLVATLRC